MLDAVVGITWPKTQSSNVFLSDEKWLACWFKKIKRPLTKKEERN